jgi:hypothetical protein
MVMEVKDSPPPAPPEATGSLGSRLLAVLRIFLPAPIQEAHKQGLLPLLGYVVFALVVFPLVVAFLAAFWLSMAKSSPYEWLRSLHQSYVQEIQRGFSINEVVERTAAAQNLRLDYLQLIEFTLDDQDIPRTYPIHVMKGQRAALQMTEVVPNPLKVSNCTFSAPKLGVDVLNISIGRKVFKACPQVITKVGGCTAELGASEWDKFADEFEPGGTGQQVVTDLTFARAPSLSSSCSTLNVQGTLMVYKDVFEMPPAKR